MGRSGKSAFAACGWRQSRCCPPLVRWRWGVAERRKERHPRRAERARCPRLGPVPACSKNKAAWTRCTGAKGNVFVTVGGGAAALTGLVFVAMSLGLRDIAWDANRARHRARTILTALTTVFIRCGLVLIGSQTARAVGAELFVAAAAAASR